MVFLVSVETPSRGSLVLGYLGAVSQKDAQDNVALALVSAGIPIRKISKQVTDYTVLTIGLHKISIIPVREFYGKISNTTAALIS